MPIVIQGFSSTDKVPGFVGETIFGAGPISLASIPLTLLLVGLSTSDGTMVQDQDIKDVISETDVNTNAGSGSELARMAYKSLLYKGLRIKMASPSTAVGASAAGGTITIAGTWTEVGQWSYRIAGEKISGTVLPTDDETDVAAAIAAAVNANAKMPVTATSTSGAVDLTCKTPGVRGNDILIYQDTTHLPGGCTSTLAGGTALTGGVTPLTGGAGVEDVTTLLSLLYPGRYHRIAIAQHDSTTLDDWKTQLDSKAGPLEGRMEHLVFASTASLSSTASLAQTTCNAERMQSCWLLYGESTPSEIAASMAALRTQKEQSNPNSSYDGDVLLGIVGQSQDLDKPQRATQQAALDEGVTPLTTDDNGNVVVIRAITTHSRNGSDPDYNTLDVADAVVPDYVRDYDRLSWATQFLPANPYVRSDTAPEDPEPPQGIATPTRWNQQLAVNGAALEKLKILTETATNPPVSEWDSEAKRIMSIHPAIPLPKQHAIGVSVRQLNPS